MMADAPEFKQPTPYNPDGVVGDTVDEVVSPFVQPPPHGPQEHTSDFVEPVHHNPDLVVGDTLDEVQSTFSTPTPHNPSLVVGDTLNEVAQPPTLSVPNVPWTPQDVTNPPPHVPGGIIGDDISEVQQPFNLETPNQPWNPNDVPLPPRHVPVDAPADPGVSAPPTLISNPPPPEAVAQANSEQHVPRTVHEIMMDLRARDEKLESYLSRLDDTSFYHSIGGPADGPGSRGFDITVTTKVLGNYITHAGKYGVPAFIAIQSALHRMNAKYAKIFNPAYIALLAGPSSFNKIALDADDDVHNRMSSIEDKLMVEQHYLGKGEYSKIASENSFNLDAPYGDGSIIPMGGFVDLAMGGSSFNASQLSKDVEYGGGIKRKQIDMSKMFDGRTGKLLPRFVASEAGTTEQENSKLVAGAFNWRGSKGVIPSAMNSDDEQYGYVEDEIDDDTLYVPLMIQDLRPGPDGAMRRIYFRALNVQSGESFSPNWNEDEAFGRVDPIVGYRGTGRSITLSFLVHAFSPEDLKVIYKKRQWLTSLVYPEISDDLMMTSGPICRLRVGDLYNNVKGGLPGVLKSLDFDDAEQVWELRRGSKVPHGFGVNLTFQVLHEGTPGINRGHFTTVRASIPDRQQSDPARFEPIKTEVDDRLFSSSPLPRRRS